MITPLFCAQLYQSASTKEGDLEFGSSIRAMGYWGSHNIYTQPGSYIDASLSKSPSRSRPFGRSSSGARLAPLQGSMSSSSLYMVTAVTPSVPGMDK